MFCINNSLFHKIYKRKQINRNRFLRYEEKGVLDMEKKG